MSSSSNYNYMETTGANGNYSGQPGVSKDLKGGEDLHSSYLVSEVQGEIWSRKRKVPRPEARVCSQGEEGLSTWFDWRGLNRESGRR